jgi:hypothetical protein
MTGSDPVNSSVYQERGEAACALEVSRDRFVG